MTQAQSKSYGGVKKKLMGAICMLLVASIMVVSSTYAWFTLSTAPEITGISTSVGANGNLEMALLNTQTFANTDQIKSAVGNSMDAAGTEVTAANVTWGNLVDLSKGYGLEKVALMPSELNVTEEGATKLNTVAFLSTAQYGTDGRVTQVDANTTSAIYDSTKSAFEADGTNQDYGVRAIGTADGLSAREIALRGAKSAFTIAMNQAKSYANSAFADNVSALVALAAADGDTSISGNQVKSIKNVAVAMKNALNETEKAYRQAILAYAASKEDVTDNAFQELQATITSIDFTTLKTHAGSMSGELAALEKAQAHVETVIGNLDQYTGSGTTGATLKSECNLLLNSSASRIAKPGPNGEIALITVRNTERTGAETGTCVFGDVADFVGSFNYVVETLGGIKVEPNGDAKLTTVATAVKGYNAAGGVAGAGASINDTYGYIMDMAFRTNVASSNLQLQTAGVNRIYSDLTDGSATQGGGSTMKFSYTAGLTGEQATKLLKAVRVVFFDPETGTIYGIAAADEINAGNDTATANLHMIKTTKTIEHKITNLGKDAYEEKDGAYMLKVGNYPAATETNTYSGEYKVALNASGYNALPAKTTAFTYTEVVNEMAEDKTAITALTQGEAKKVSILVYMDGNSVDNSAVANAASSGVLTMNLQFSSSAELIPMENSALRGADTHGEQRAARRNG